MRPVMRYRAVPYDHSRSPDPSLNVHTMSDGSMAGDGRAAGRQARSSSPRCAGLSPDASRPVLSLRFLRNKPMRERYAKRERAIASSTDRVVVGCAY